jgi:hypothetical protein
MTQPVDKTIVFADVSGSVRLFERLAEADATQAINECVERMKHATTLHHGRLLQVTGDELQALFDHPDDACSAAIEMQSRIAELAPVCALKLSIRVGIHCGQIYEQFDTLLGEAVNTAARITGMARADQILASARFISSLPLSSRALAMPTAATSGIREGHEQIELMLIDWQQQPHPSLQPIRAKNAGIDSPPTLPTSDRLCLRYRGKAFLLDDRTPTLTLGRDPSSKLLIEDRKASRTHGRVEKRKGKYFYIDLSTNGSFVSLFGQAEVMIRKDEIQLLGAGRICFGNSRNDALADYADFEYL